MKPAKLKRGDTIVILSPASAVAAFVPRRLGRAVDYLEKLGFKVRLSEHATARCAHTAGTIEERVADLHAAFRDPEVKAIITTIGGFNSHQLLDELDYDLIRNNPKILLGYSDITSLHAGIYAKTGLVTFLGPAILPQFGEFGGLHPFSLDSLERTLMKAEPAGELGISAEWTDEHLLWDEQDDRLKQFKPNKGLEIIRQGRATGKIIAGNVGTLLLLAGTPYMPSFDDVILLVEDEESETPSTLDRYFTQLRHLGVYDKIKGMVVGRFSDRLEFSDDMPLSKIILRATRGYDFPIVLGADFGHTDPMLTLPLGVELELDARSQARMRITENAVSE